MFEIVLYTLGKKINSTRTPSETTTSVTLNCVTKDSFDIINPVIKISHNNPTTYNYARIVVLNRYYFINKWVYENGLWIGYLSVDVLASFKTQIGGNSEYILRSSNSFNLSLVDNLYPIESESIIERQTLDSPWDIENGMYIVSILGSGTSSYYLIHEDEFNAMLTYLFSDAYLDSIYPMWYTTMPDIKIKTNPLQFISSVKWIPFKVTLTSDIVTSIRVGYGTVPCTAQVVPDNSIRVIERSFSLLKHPQAERGNYLNKSPYTCYTLFYPPFGLIELDSSIIGSVNTLKTRVEIDLRTGACTLTISIDSDFNSFKAISWIHSNLSIDVQLSQITNPKASVFSVIKPIAQLVTGNPIGSITSSIGNIGDITRSMIPTATSIGSDGSKNSFTGSITLIYNFKRICEENKDNFGRPLCEHKNIAELSGYMVIDKPIPVIKDCTYEELEQIKTYMMGGFYYE